MHETEMLDHMRYRPSKRVTWLVIPLLPVLFMAAGVWYAGRSDDADIASRGSRPPPSRGVSKPMDWCDDGFSALMTWKLNPWKNKFDKQFGSHFDTLKSSDNPEDQKKARELLKLGKEWYERILVRYPELAVTYKDLPEDQNGLLQWKRFEKRLRDAKDPHSPLLGLPVDLAEHFGNSKDKKPWNAESTKAWLDENRALLDEARAIALMPDQSSAGHADSDQLAESAGIGAGRDFSKAFLMEAHLLAEQGDIAGALESIRAATGIANHLRNGEAPNLYEGLNGAYIQRSIERYVFTDILPGLPEGQRDVAIWENAINPKLREPADFARLVRGEWNAYMQKGLLPALADTTDFSTPNDGEALAEAYTQSYMSLATQNESLTLAELPSNPVVNLPHDNLSWRSRDIAKDHGIMEGGYNLRDSWERNQIQTGMTQAAFAIIKGEPIPNDPIRGLPYVWDPATRKLSLPEIPEYKRIGIKPLVLPEF